MSLVKSLFQNKATKFTPASSEVEWTRIETLVHGPGAGTQSVSINSAVFACLMAIATSYPEPPLVVKRRYRSGDVQERLEHPLQALLDNPTPNGELSIEELLFWTAWAKHVDGNAYWMKVRSGDNTTGNVVELWPVSPTAIEPITEPNTDDWISYYKYHIRPNEIVKVPIENVVHFRLGLDDHDMRKGLSPLKALIREISTDNEADNYTAALLKNYAVPGLVVIPTAGTSLTEADADRITDRLRRKFGGDNRGNIAVLSRETTVSDFGFSPKDLEMTTLHRIPEERISAVLGVPAIVAGLGAGLENATYSNARELREMFTEQKLIPLWRADAAKLNASLLPDFTRTRNAFVEFDITNVRALQEDENEKYARLALAVGNKPWLTVNEARTEIGYDPIEGGDDMAEPEPEPQPVPEQLQQEQPTEEPEAQELEETPSSKAERLNELRRWWRVCAKEMRAKKPLPVAWEPEALDRATVDRIGKDLLRCADAKAVGDIFKRELGINNANHDYGPIIEAIRLGVEALKIEQTAT